MKSIIGLVQGGACRIDIEFKTDQGKPYKKFHSIKTKHNDTEEIALYTTKDNICGEVRLTPLTNKKIEHQGARIQLIGQIELASERGQPHEFVSLSRELIPPSELNSIKTYPFDFRNVEMQYDSYKGHNARCWYFLRVTVVGKGITPDSQRDIPIWVSNYEVGTEATQPIKMEVGIEDCLHIEFEYDKGMYHLSDVVVGKIYFLLVRIKLKYMEIEIRRRETVGVNATAKNETDTIAKFEIMDGAPVRNETIPIRLYLSPYELTPTYRDVQNKFSVRYFLNLVLVDEEDRRYFKQQEITLYRKAADASGQIDANPAGEQGLKQLQS
uniref:Uncharacterized protein n=1 Tax=Polytomella parva TaxID=51329 RepID=A0A7S0UQN2_9CHLO|mmetsp:Transcript_11227/g.20329  ORF Transcript_11227/g.20329 Transcript_11227/m.20329 type:complete len:326 (+) Transcript_11227:172-1149(+)|eukprot:CAMPEP_0175071748 /NCGR_PEP_ID=MMETSP0052_2-20121109/19433_1 /TAXON_ID=51329 ORGANISM="Polytomella parva, Strain SAG 63-3" /NCGR_SAMPLE_ID=MMETSP0052_2 /ASSEMBLY_ACC=CAM_ASM_000194 /LENGTH=325 /DNA_ID=CAMNT_0016338989 /DNA_START=103 /DNA_END=1080 /DNA_ORIENTATION=-